MYLKHLGLRNFRNYQELELELPPGLVVVYGGNGQGKSNLLEAAYLLALTRSHRAESERELVRFEALEELPYTRVVGVVRRREDTEVRVQVDMALSPPSATPDGDPGGHLRKRIRVNGVPKLASEAVGAVTMVPFAAEDIEMATGPPAGRRRFLDILASQIDRRYVRALQSYQKVLTQRNHLLRRLREGASSPEELPFWDAELCTQGAYIIQWRVELVAHLAPLAAQAYQGLAGEREALEVRIHQKDVSAGTRKTMGEVGGDRGLPLPGDAAGDHDCSQPGAGRCASSSPPPRTPLREHERRP